MRDGQRMLAGRIVGRRVDEMPERNSREARTGSGGRPERDVQGGGNEKYRREAQEDA
jgi:hypothetical protein